MSKSTKLLDAALAKLKAEAKDDKGKSYFRDVKEYGGEFTSTEISFDSFSAPAAFVTCLGWQPEPNAKTLAGNEVNRIRMVVFILTKDPNRANRFRAAMQRTELLTTIFKNWKPGKGMSKPIGMRAENLFNRGSDKKGMALWMLSWWHEIGFDSADKPSVEDLPDLVSVDVRTEGHVPPVTGDDVPEPDLTYETKINLENSDEQQY